MSYKKSCFIRKNTEELRNKLIKLGYDYGGKSGCGNDDCLYSSKNVGRFFERYPKLSKNVYICGDDKLYENVIKTLERRGGINAINYIGDGEALYYIDPATNYIEICTRDYKKLYNLITSTFEKIEPDKFIEMTLPEIAEKLGIDVELLRIKK